MPKCSIKTRYFPAVFAWTLFLVTTGVFFYYPCRYFIYRYPWIPISEGIIAFFVLANFSLATFMDPGIIPKAPPDEDRDDDFRAPLYKNVDISGITVRMKWCVTCKFYRPPRCSHCSVCNHCIETFDHHCPWMNNCIGRRNYRFFFFFLITLSLHMISVFSVCLFFVLKHKDKIKGPDVIASLAIMALIILLVIPIFGLTGFHMVLVSRGRTTNEQVTGKFKGGYNPFSRGCFRNCCYIQCGPHYPSITNPKKLMYKRRDQISFGPISTITNDNQVKTYTEITNSNGGVRNIVGSHSYNKLSPRQETNTMAYEIDIEPTASSQSMDCEPTPPSIQRQGSKINNSTVIEPSRYRATTQPNVRNSPHPKHRNLDQKSSRSYISDDDISNSNENSRSALSTQQRIMALGVPTPIVMSSAPIRRSNPGTPTQVRRPDFINVSETNKQSSTIYDFPPKSNYINSYYYQQQPLYSHTKPSTMHTNNSNSPQRYISTKENITQQSNRLTSTNSYQKNNENIRELVGSPQKSMYTWKDNSPGALNYNTTSYDYTHSNPTSPTQLQLNQNKTNIKQYHPAIRGGVAVYPQGSPQPHRKTQQLLLHTSHTLPDNNRRRPMSFARALEMSDSMEMVPNLTTTIVTTTTSTISSMDNSKKDTSDRTTSIYDLNYEISV